MKEKTPLLNEFVCFQIGIKDRNYLPQKLRYFRGSDCRSHNVLYYQQLSNARYQVSF